MHALSAEQATGALSSEDAVPSRVSEVVGRKVDDDVRAPGRGWPVVPVPGTRLRSWVHLGNSQSEASTTGTRPGANGSSSPVSDQLEYWNSQLSEVGATRMLLSPGILEFTIVRGQGPGRRLFLNFWFEVTRRWTSGCRRHRCWLLLLGQGYLFSLRESFSRFGNERRHFAVRIEILEKFV